MANQIVPLSKFYLHSPLKFGPGSHAGVVSDPHGHPQVFVFNTTALLDLLSTIDSALETRLSPTDYHSKTVNPAGWLIDEIESRLSPQKSLQITLREALLQVEKSGLIQL